MSAVASISQILPGVPVISPSPSSRREIEEPLDQKGNVKLAVAVTDTLTGGDASTQSVNVQTESLGDRALR